MTKQNVIEGFVNTQIACSHISVSREYFTNLVSVALGDKMLAVFVGSCFEKKFQSRLGSLD